MSDEQQPSAWASYAQVLDPARDHQILMFITGGGKIYWTCSCVSDPQPGSTRKTPLGLVSGRDVDMAVYEYRQHVDAARGLGYCLTQQQ